MQLIEFALPFCFTVEKENAYSSWSIHLDDEDISTELQDSRLKTEVEG